MRFSKVGLAAVAAALSLTSVAKAETVILDVGAMDHARTVTIAGLGNASAAPMQFQGTWGGKTVSLIAWCVDVYHHISVKDYVPDLIYTDTVAHTTDFNGKALDAGDTLKVRQLVNYGQDLFDTTAVAPAAFTSVKPVRSSYPNGSAGTAAYNSALSSYNTAKSAHTAATNAYNAAVSLRYTRLSAVQSAIWQVVSNRNVTSANNDAAFDLLVDNLSGDHLTDYFAAGLGDKWHKYSLITPVQQYGGKNGTTKLALTQSFATAAIPEPGVWLMMILGFGGAGAMLRRSRRAVAAV